MSAVPLFETDAALFSWLQKQGLEHVARLGMEVLAPKLGQAFWPSLRSAGNRRRLIELLSDESLARWKTGTAPSQQMKTLLPPLARTHLEQEQEGATQARASLAERLQPPEDPRTHAVHRLLLAARATFPVEVAPRPRQTLNPGGLVVDPQLPGFVLKEPGPLEVAFYSNGGFVLPKAQLLFSPEEIKLSCRCGAITCVHALAAIDTALEWLRQPWTDGSAQVLEDLTRAPWERTLRALERVLEENPGGGQPFEVTWRLEVISGYGVEVFPSVHRRNKKGGRSAGIRLSKRKFLLEHGAHLSASDARLAALLPDLSGPASHALLYELVGHPRLFLDGAPDLPVRVEREKVGLVAEDRGGTVVVTAGIEGTALPPPLLERVRRAKAEEVLYLWDQGARRLTVLDVTPEVRALLGVLSRLGNTFPPESHSALLPHLAKLALKLPVAMPRSVMGESAPPVNLPVLRLAALPSGAVRLELRVRPLPDSGTFVPGEGVRDVHVRRGTQAFHAVRDFVRERAEAEALQASLPLHGAEPEEAPYTFFFTSAQGGLALLSVARALDPTPELEWVGAPLQLVGSRGLSAFKMVLEKRRDWFGVLGNLAVEGERVQLARLLDAARRKERFVQVEGLTYVEVESSLREHLERLSDHVYTSRHGLELSPGGAETIRSFSQSGAEVETDQAWQTLAQRIFAAKELKPKIPTVLKAKLRDYQREGLFWLIRLASWGAGAVLADDMGLGKTVQALALLLERSKSGPALVLAPTSVAFNWIDEAKRFAPSLKMILYAEAEDRGGALERLGPKDVLVLSYGLLTRDVERLSSLHFSTIIFDEAQALKNASTHRFRAARSLKGDFKVVLSGTPLENHLGELWALFALVFPGLLGSWESFRSRFAAPIANKTDPTAAPALARVLAPFLLRRTKSQVEKQLPPRTDVRVPVVLSPAEWQLYEDTRLAALSDLERHKAKLKDEERRIQVLAALTRLRLLASHPRLYDPNSLLESSKLDRLMELIDELRAEGQRALVFSQFTSHLKLVREVLDARDIPYAYLDGQTPQGARRATVRAFQEGDAPLFLISLKAGGFGLNLTAATSVIHLDPWWNPAVEDQASDRAHRLGQTKPVTVYRLVTRGTLEEQMLSLHEHKRALVADVLEGKDGAGRLTTQELLGLLSQRLAPREEIYATRH